MVDSAAGLGCKEVEPHPMVWLELGMLGQEGRGVSWVRGCTFSPESVPLCVFLGTLGDSAGLSLEHMFMVGALWKECKSKDWVLRV